MFVQWNIYISAMLSAKAMIQNAYYYNSQKDAVEITASNNFFEIFFKQTNCNVALVIAVIVCLLSCSIQTPALLF